MKLADLFKLSRKERNLSLIQLSQQTGISYSMLYRLEEGDIEQPHPDLLRKIAPALCLCYEDLLSIAGYLQGCNDSPLKTSQSQNLQRIPIFKWNALKNINYSKPLHSNQWLEFSSNTHSLFATHIPLDLNLSPFKYQDLIVVQINEKKNLKSGQKILVCQKNFVYISQLQSADNHLYVNSFKYQNDLIHIDYVDVIGIIICHFL